jgi:hypothetical protein
MQKIASKLSLDAYKDDMVGAFKIENKLTSTVAYVKLHLSVTTLSFAALTLLAIGCLIFPLSLRTTTNGGRMVGLH